MKKINGLVTALITPFKNGKVDFQSLENLIEHQLANNVEGFVVNGTTAESPTLSDLEVEEIFKFVQRATKGAVPLILGTGTNSTQTSIQKTKQAAALGADAALVVVPYYNKPPQRGLFLHFSEIANQCEIPIILYNVPGRTITSLDVETVASLSQNKKIIGIKEASGNKDVARELRKQCRKDFILLSGDDGTYVDFLEAGGDGVISVASHIISTPMSNWRKWYLENKIELAQKDSQKHLPLIDLLFCEANPIPVKKAVQLMGLIDSAELRLPLVELSEAKAQELQNEMKKQGLLR